jgi:hypothetical protein
MSRWPICRACLTVFSTWIGSGAPSVVENYHIVRTSGMEFFENFHQRSETNHLLRRFLLGCRKCPGFMGYC